MKIMTKLVVKEGEKLVCFGTGEVGVEFAEICKEQGRTISYFCDNDKNKWGTDFYGVPVLSLEELLAKNENLVFLISNVRYQVEIALQLEAHGVDKIYIATVETAWLTQGILSTKDLFHIQRQYKHEKRKQDDPKAVCVPATTVSIIEKCTLNCRYCSAKVPYKTEYQTMTLEKFRERVDEIVTFMDSVLALRIIGGEPTLHPDLYEMLEYAGSKEEICSINVTTNSTLLLNEEQLNTVNKEKVIFILSDYREHSRKLEENAQLLEKAGVVYRVQNYETWFDLYMDLQLQEDNTDLKERFSNCLNGRNNCAFLANGHFMRCGMSYSGYASHTVPEEDLGWVDLDVEKRTIAEIKEELRAYLKKDYLAICKYCTGIDLSRAQPVPVAEQVQGKLIWPER